MPLALDRNRNGRASVVSSCDGWVITFHCYDVVASAYKTHFGTPLWRHNFDPLLEVVPGQKIVFDRDGNLIDMSPECDG